MGRFLLFISYIGTRYSGVQIQVSKGIVRTDVRTVQGVLENKLHSFHPSNDVLSMVSSRTDAGVHAFCNAIQVDLQHERYPEKTFDPNIITVRMNKMLGYSGEQIRILKTTQVPDDFNCRRKAVCRSYMYRIAVPRNQNDFFHRHLCSPFDMDRYHVVPISFDIDKLLEAAKAMTGTHNFTAFTPIKTLTEAKKNPIKTMNIGVKRCQGFENTDFGKRLDFWEIHVTSRSFLYKQVRRMVGAMLSVASGKVSVDWVRSVLKDPDCTQTEQKITTAPPGGLFLRNVLYNEQDLQYAPQSNKNLNQEIPVKSNAEFLSVSERAVME